MKKLLFTLLISLFFIPGVNADELPKVPVEGMGFANSCSKNLFDPTFGIAYYNPNFYPLTSTTTRSYPVPNNFIPVKPNTTYFYSSDRSEYTGIIELTSDLVLAIPKYQQWNNTSFTTSANTYYVTFSYYIASYMLDNYWFQLEEGDTQTEYVPYELCPSGPVVDTTLDSFYSLYVSKLQALAEYATENKFLLGTIGIILLFVVLELVLNLFRKGGYR